MQDTYRERRGEATWEVQSGAKVLCMGTRSTCEADEEVGKGEGAVAIVAGCESTRAGVDGAAGHRGSGWCQWELKGQTSSVEKRVAAWCRGGDSDTE